MLQCESFLLTDLPECLGPLLSTFVYIDRWLCLVDLDPHGIGPRILHSGRLLQVPTPKELLEGTQQGPTIPIHVSSPGSNIFKPSLRNSMFCKAFMTMALPCTSSILRRAICLPDSIGIPFFFVAFLRPT